MANKKKETVKVDWKYLNNLFKKNGTGQVEIAKLLGHSHAYYSHWVKGGEIPKADLEKICDLMEVDYVALCPNSSNIDLETVMHNAINSVEALENTKRDNAITALIAEIGELRGEIAELKKRVDNPVPVSIPMNAKDMAIEVMGNLLDGGWVSKDTVLIEFNKHHIPCEYIRDALRANKAISATSGVAHEARTFYIKESEVGIA